MLFHGFPTPYKVPIAECHTLLDVAVVCPPVIFCWLIYADTLGVGNGDKMFFFLVMFAFVDLIMCIESLCMRILKKRRSMQPVRGLWVLSPSSIKL